MTFSRSALGALAGASLVFCSSFATAQTEAAKPAAAKPAAAKPAAPKPAAAKPAAAKPAAAKPAAAKPAAPKPAAAKPAAAKPAAPKPAAAKPAAAKPAAQPPRGAPPALPPGHPPTSGNRPAGPIPRRSRRPQGRPPGAPPAGQLPPPQLGMAFMGQELRVSALVPATEFPYADDNADQHLNTKEIATHQAELVKDITARFSTLNEAAEPGETGIVRVGVPPQGPEKGYPIIRFLLSRKFAAPPKTMELNYAFFENFDGEVMGFLNLGANRTQFKLTPDEGGFIVDIAASAAGKVEVEMLSSADDAAWWYPDSTPKKGFWFLGIGTLIAALFLGLGSRKEPQAS